MKELHIPPLGGGENINYFVQYEHTPALLRVSRGNKVNDTLGDYYNYTGFSNNDQGRVQKRTPREQYDFCRKAVTAGLAVLPPLALTGSNLIYPFIGHAQTLMGCLQENSIPPFLPAIFLDIRKAHRTGLIYGDRNAENVLVDDRGFIHIDFDLAISGPTAREFEVAELSTHILHFGGKEIAPTLAATLGTMCAQTPKWIDIEKTTTYMRRMGQMLHEARGADPSILVNQESLITSWYAVRDSVRSCS